MLVFVICVHLVSCDSCSLPQTLGNYLQSKYQTMINKRFGCGFKIQRAIKKIAIFTSKPGAGRLLKQMQYAQCARLTLCLLGKFSCFFFSFWIFSKSTISKNFFRNTTRVSNSSDLDLVWHFVRPVLVLNCLQKMISRWPQLGKELGWKLYNKTCVKRPLINSQNKGLNDNW